MNTNPVASGESLYKKEPKIYPRDVTGRFAVLRKISVYVLLGLYYVLPWIQIGGQQSVLFDLPARQFHLFGLTFWPQDFIYLALLLISAGLTLFFFTALAGRLWCGFACPQTVWTEVFLWMEKWVEGDRNKRMKLDKGPWDRNKIVRKSVKHFLWITFALWTGFTFVGFFTPIREFGQNILSASIGPWETFWWIFYSFATYGNAGFLREQVCKYMCPYARFQSAMFDHDTLIISYDEKRGEPRGGRRKSADLQELGLGDCIDCTLCVQVCPTGIDIRDGLQYECIACAACVDVCDQVMDKMDYPRGLIRYTTENALEGKKSRIARPRIFIYGTILTVILVGTIWNMTTRIPLRADLIRDRNQLYRELSDGRIENVYTLKIVNMDQQAHRYNISMPGNDTLTWTVDPEPSLGPGEVGRFSFTVQASPDLGSGSVELDVRFESESDPGIFVVSDTRFLLPAGQDR